MMSNAPSIGNAMKNIWKVEDISLYKEIVRNKILNCHRELSDFSLPQTFKL